MFQFQEAVNTSEKFYEHSARGERIPCPRPGCKDHLASASNLVYHLHIHNIEDKYVQYLLCPVDVLIHASFDQFSYLSSMPGYL